MKIYTINIEGGNSMLSTIKSESNKLLIDTNDLKLMLSCGRATAVSIGLAARARIRINKRVLWNVELVREYINSTSDQLNQASAGDINMADA